MAEGIINFRNYNQHQLINCLITRKGDHFNLFFLVIFCYFERIIKEKLLTICWLEKNIFLLAFAVIL